MRIGVISDTHNEVHATQCALRIFDEMDVKVLIHCGDIGASVIPLFAGRQTHFVLGNTDDAERLRETIDASNNVLHDEFGELEIAGRRVAFLHGHDVARFCETVSSGNWDLVCFGHSHSFSNERSGRTVTLNPGALSRTNFPSVAVVDLPSLEVTRMPV